MHKTIKNITIATCCVVGCSIHGATLAAVGCFSAPSVSSVASAEPADYSIEWARNDNYGGIAVCTDKNQGTGLDQLNITLTTNIFASCYCKLLRPAVSKWFLHTSFSGLDCTKYCAQYCWSTSYSNFTF